MYLNCAESMKLITDYVFIVLLCIINI